MKKFFRIKTLSFLLVLSIVLSCSFGSYALASESKWYDGFWNDTKTIKENLVQHAILVGTAGGIAWSLATGELFTGVASGSASLGNIKAFDEFMADRGFDIENEEEMKQLITYNSETKNFTISDSFNDVTHEYINQFLDEATGYVTIPTTKITDLPVELFASKSSYENLAELYEQIGEPFFFGGHSYSNFYFVNRGGYHFLPHYTSSIKDFDSWLFEYENFSTTEVGSYFTTCLDLVSSDWTTSIIDRFCFLHDDFKSSELCTCGSSVYLYNFDKKELKLRPSTNGYLGFYFTSPRVYNFPKGFSFLVSVEGEPVKVWNSLDSFKQYDIGRQPYYASNEWVNYDYSNTDNSTYSESFIDNSIKDSNNQTTYNEIVNNYHEGMTESEVAHLIETIMKNQKEINNTPPSSDGGGGSSSGGSGLGALLDGIGGLLDFIVTLIGKVVSLITDTLTTILNSFSGFTNLFSGFTEFLSSAFSFVPEEVWSILISGCSVMVVLAIIKFLKG